MLEPRPSSAEQVVRRLAAVGFPAGFAAVAPFLGQLAAFLPLAVDGSAGRPEHLAAAANAGQVGFALSPVWVLVELALPRLPGSPVWRAVGLGLAAALLLAASSRFAGLPAGSPWVAWGAGLAAGLAGARTLAGSRAAWTVLPAVTTFAAHHAWRLAMLPDPVWSVASAGPLVAGAVAGLVVRHGVEQGRRWGPVPL